MRRRRKHVRELLPCRAAVLSEERFRAWRIRLSRRIKQRRKVRDTVFVNCTDDKAATLNSQWSRQVESHYFVVAARPPNEGRIRLLLIARSIALGVEIHNDAIERIGFDSGNLEQPFEADCNGAQSSGITRRS